MAVPGELQETARQAGGSTVVLAGWDGQARGLLTIADTLRPGGAEAVRRILVLMRFEGG